MTCCGSALELMRRILPSDIDSSVEAQALRRMGATARVNIIRFMKSLIMRSIAVG
jgi:hypothetical protein